MNSRILKMVSLFMAVCLLMALPVYSSAFLRGDIDNDSKVTAADARLALRFSVGLENFTAEQKKAADISNDGSVTAADARTILRMSVGLFDSAEINGQLAEHYDGDFSSFETVYAEPVPEYRRAVILSTSADVKDFRIVSIDIDDNMNYVTTTIRNCGTFSADEKIVVYVMFSDMYPSYGFIYTDTDGTEKFYGFDTDINGSTVILRRMYKLADVSVKKGSKYLNYPKENTVFATVSNFSVPLIVTTDTRITDFKVLNLEYDYENGKKNKHVIKNCGTIEAGESVNIFVTFSDMMPLYGFSYVDTDGTEKVFSFFESGYDGSLIVDRETEYTDSAPSQIHINATFGDNVYYDYSQFPTVYASRSQYRYPVIISTNMPVYDMKIVGIDWPETPKVHKVNSTYNIGTVLPGEPVVAYVYMPEWTPIYAVAYTDTNGKERAFTIVSPINGAGDKVYYALGNEITLIK